MGRKSNRSVPVEELQATLRVSFITDPLCCWSYGMEIQLDRLQRHFGDRLALKYIMGGMLPSWNQFHDETNNVSRPIQMGPVWMHAAQLMGRALQHQLWMKDPPSSSWPACIAVKCADRQNAEAGMAFFKMLQQTAMEYGKNIASWQVIEDAAKALQIQNPSFDVVQFVDDYHQKRGVDAFRADLATVAQYRITRFPTLIIETTDQKGILIPGYRSFEDITTAIAKAFGIQ